MRRGDVALINLVLKIIHVSLKAVKNISKIFRRRSDCRYVMGITMIGWMN